MPGAHFLFLKDIMIALSSLKFLYNILSVIDDVPLGKPLSYSLVSVKLLIALTI